ncbi:MAG: hypothetical protein K8H88_20295, partial [Sandaracinaceae bacterium]|nr:hypothetical protein [Sandaracinaceae bacterium]
MRSPSTWQLVAAVIVVAAGARAQTGVVVRAEDPALASELRAAAPAALAGRTRVIDVSATPAAARLDRDPDTQAALERLRVELDLEVVVLAQARPEAGRIALRVRSTAGGPLVER